MKVAFWSNVRGKNGVTSNLAGICVMSAMEHRLKSTVIENHFNINNIENAFTNYRNQCVVKEENYYFNHVGVDCLLKRLHSKSKDGNLIKKSSMSFLNNSIFYIPQSKISSKEIFEYELNQVIHPLLAQIEKHTDVAFIDTANCNNMTSKIILSEADLVVVNLSQDIIIMNHFFENYSSLISKAVFIIGNYNKESKHNLKNISRKYHIEKENIAVIPYNVEFKESLSEGSVIEFLSRNYNCKQEDDNHYFIKELRKATTMIANKIVENKTGVITC